MTFPNLSTTICYKTEIVYNEARSCSECTTSFSLFIVLALSVKSIPALLRPQSYIISMKLQNNF